MKVFILLFTLLFSYSILADCCLVEDISDTSTNEFSQSHEHNDSHAKTGNQELCHCTFSCSPKILMTQVFTVATLSYILSQDFPHYIEHFKNLDPLPILQPPIV